MKKGLTLVLLVFASASCLLIAQNAPAEPENSKPTVEQLFLNRIELSIIEEGSASDDPELKMAALENISEMIDGTELSSSETDRLLAVLTYYLGLEPGASLPDKSLFFMKRKSYELIGRIGGGEGQEHIGKATAQPEREGTGADFRSIFCPGNNCNERRGRL